MTYHNRLLTTPYYINNIDSAFWSLIAHNTAHNIGEKCGHNNYLLKSVSCIQSKTHCRCIVTCKKCDYVFSSTGKAIVNMIGYFGF